MRHHELYLRIMIVTVLMFGFAVFADAAPERNSEVLDRLGIIKSEVETLIDANLQINTRLFRENVTEDDINTLLQVVNSTIESFDAISDDHLRFLSERVSEKELKATFVKIADKIHDAKWSISKLAENLAKYGETGNVYRLEDAREYYRQFQGDFKEFPLEVYGMIRSVIKAVK